MSSHSHCNKCTNQTSEPHFLNCDHSFCYRCVVKLYNEHWMEHKKQARKRGLTHFPCGVAECKMMTEVPEGGLRNLPRSSRGLTDAMGALSLASAKNTDVSAKQFEGATVLWRKEGYEGINSLAVMDDGSCLLVSSVGKTQIPVGLVHFSSFALQRISSLGEPVELPFPCFPTSPIAIAVNQASNFVALVDNQGKDGRQVSVYHKTGDHCQSRSFVTHRNIQQVAVTEDGCVVLGALSGRLQQELVMMTVTGQEDLSMPLPGGLYKTYISVNKDLIIISSMNSDTVSIVSIEGELLHTLPTEFIQEPRGVTSDSLGRLIIANYADRSICLFTQQGQFVQTLVKCQQSPLSVSLSQDRFLLVAEYNQDEDSYELCLYELN